MRFLEIVQIFKKQLSEKKKFRLYNNELINKLKDVQNKFQLMNDYIEQGGLIEDGDEYMGGEFDDGEMYMDEKGYLSKYPYY